jgi:hypothetical protein
MLRVAASSCQITVPQPGVTLGEQVIQRGGRVDNEQATLRVSGQKQALSTWSCDVVAGMIAGLLWR